MIRTVLVKQHLDLHCEGWHVVPPFTLGFLKLFSLAGQPGEDQNRSQVMSEQKDWGVMSLGYGE